MKVLKTIEIDGERYDLVRPENYLRKPCLKCIFFDMSPLCGIVDRTPVLSTVPMRMM